MVTPVRRGWSSFFLVFGAATLISAMFVSVTEDIQVGLITIAVVFTIFSLIYILIGPKIETPLRCPDCDGALIKPIETTAGQQPV